MVSVRKKYDICIHERMKNIYLMSFLSINAKTQGYTIHNT